MKNLYAKPSIRTLEGLAIALVLALSSIAYPNTATAQGMTDAQRVPLMQRTINRQAKELNQCAVDIANNIRVIPMEYDDCIAVMMAFFVEYPTYHLETSDQSIVIDYRITWPEEEAAQVCHFIIEEYNQNVKLYSN